MCSQPTQLIKALCGLASFMIRCINWMKGLNYRTTMILTFFHIFFPRDSQSLQKAGCSLCSNTYVHISKNTEIE